MYVLLHIYFDLRNVVINFRIYFILQVYLLASKQIHLTGEDFTKLLEWKPQSL